MSILKKIATAFRGGAREVGELIVDANGTRIFEQELKDAQAWLAKLEGLDEDVLEVFSGHSEKVEEAKKAVETLAQHVKGANRFLSTICSRPGARKRTGRRS